MALDGTYTGLKASVADFLNRADLTAVIPDFIVLAESQMMRRFVGRQKQGMPIPRRLIARTDLTIADAAEYISVPSDFFGPIDFTLPTSPITDLDYLDSTNLVAEKARNFWQGTPKFYTVVGDKLQLFPVADDAYTGELTYIARTAALSTANQATNWIYQSYPDAYLYGALTASAPYLKDDSRTTLWEALFAEAVDAICNADPMPSDKSQLRTAFPELMRRGRWAYNINSDS